MPRIERDGLYASLDAFVTGFRRSKRGNLWRVYAGRTLTVFRRTDGRWGWCVADDYGTDFSSGGYLETADAIAALWERVGGD